MVRVFSVLYDVPSVVSIFILSGSNQSGARHAAHTSVNITLNRRNMHVVSFRLYIILSFRQSCLYHTLLCLFHVLFCAVKCARSSPLVCAVETSAMLCCSNVALHNAGLCCVPCIKEPLCVPPSLV